MRSLIWERPVLRAGGHRKGICAQATRTTRDTPKASKMKQTKPAIQREFVDIVCVTSGRGRKFREIFRSVT